MHFLRKRNRETGTFILGLPKNSIFFSWINFKVRLPFCQVIAKETPLEPDTALGLRTDSSKHKLPINFCCSNAKYYIWRCRQKKCSPKLNDFVVYLKPIYETEKKKDTTAIALKKWEPLLFLVPRKRK